MIENVSVTFTSPEKMISTAEDLRAKAFADFLKLCVIDQVIPSKPAEFMELNKLSCIFCTLDVFLRGKEEPDPPLLPEQLQCLLTSLQETWKLLNAVDPKISGSWDQIEIVLQRLAQSIKFLEVTTNE